VFTLQYGSRHATVAVADAVVAVVAPTGVFAVVASTADGSRLSVHDPDGTERFVREFDGRVGTPALSSTGEYVAVVQRTPSRLVVFDTDTGESVVDHQFDGVPDAVEFRQSDGDWWLVGGEEGVPPAVGIRLRDDTLVQ
jgi:hypothetical protein